jgi:DNA-binding XRE family transcriptional regulator
LPFPALVRKGSNINLEGPRLIGRLGHPSAVGRKGRGPGFDRFRGLETAGRRIRELRGFDRTQEEFARHIGISQNYLSTMERGNVQIGSEILLKMSSEFGKSMEWLLTGED